MFSMIYPIVWTTCCGLQTLFEWLCWISGAVFLRTDVSHTHTHTHTHTQRSTQEDSIAYVAEIVVRCLAQAPFPNGGDAGGHIQQSQQQKTQQQSSSSSSSLDQVCGGEAQRGTPASAHPFRCLFLISTYVIGKERIMLEVRDLAWSGFFLASADTIIFSAAHHM